MGQALLTITGRTYRISCRDGDEERISRLGDEIAARAERITGSLGSVPEGQLLVMTALMVADELADAYARAAAVDRVVFAEPWVTGAEYTVAVLHRRALPAIRIETARSFYDYEAKYLRDDTRYHCPAGLSAPAEAHMASLAIAAFDAIGAEGWGRVDFMADQTGRPLMLEINTIPGMTDHSLVPMAARAAGIDFAELCWQVLETSFVRRPRDGQVP
jgi:D-alanine-D-alanine ligase